MSPRRIKLARCSLNVVAVVKKRCWHSFQSLLNGQERLFIERAFAVERYSDMTWLLRLILRQLLSSLDVYGLDMFADLCGCYGLLNMNMNIMFKRGFGLYRALTMIFTAFMLLCNDGMLNNACKFSRL